MFPNVALLFARQQHKIYPSEEFFLPPPLKGLKGVWRVFLNTIILSQTMQPATKYRISRNFFGQFKNIRHVSCPPRMQFSNESEQIENIFRLPNPR